jgi:hypothetical protein
MIELAYIIGLAMALVNLFKKQLPANTVPLIAVAITVLLNIGNALLFGSDALLALKDAFIGAGILVGLFAASDTQSNRMKALVNVPQVEVSLPVVIATEEEPSS